jgi:hypothetical protein
VSGDAGEEAGEVPVVRLTATPGQRIKNLAFVATCAALGLASIVVGTVTRIGLDSDAGLVGAALLFAAAVGLSFHIRSVVGFTECSPDGIRTQGVSRSASCPWADVAKISVSDGRARRVVVTRRDRSRFDLVIPVDNGISRRDFDSQYAVVLGYWQDAVGRAGQQGAIGGFPDP